MKSLLIMYILLSSCIYADVSHMKKENKEYAIKLVDEEVKFGFYTKEEMLQSIGDAFYDDADYDEQWLKNEIKIRFNKHMKESLTWKRVTDFNRLVAAFDKLNEEKIVSLHRAGYSRQDAENNALDVIKKLKKEEGIQAKGYCYYHTQDLERAISDSNKTLFIGFGSFNGDDNLTREVANKVVEVLRENGLGIRWNRKIESRIEILNINWQKRVDKIDYGYKRIKKFIHKRMEFMKKINKQDIKILELLNKWENKEEFYSFYMVHYFILEERFDDYDDLEFLLGKENSKKHKNELIEFGYYDDGDNGKFCLWYYPKLMTKAPVVYIGPSGEPVFVAPSFEDFVSLLTQGRVITAGEDKYYVNLVQPQWGDFNDFHGQLEELAVDNKMSLKEAKKELNKNLAEFREFMCKEITCRKESEIFKDTHTHPIFKKWIEDIQKPFKKISL